MDRHIDEQDIKNEFTETMSSLVNDIDKDDTLSDKYIIMAQLNEILTYVRNGKPFNAEPLELNYEINRLKYFKKHREPSWPSEPNIMLFKTYHLMFLMASIPPNENVQKYLTALAIYLNLSRQ